ncbi:uncharacterized protein LOC132168224 [Corylus avellana]|uniref:uncharacterized protein LOC132168224 n=1 Tax=Corylus avellana TaxID=13451 RepID=UPI00286C2B44|nr:uncharacterized protein LOC132168224 [Corylus avellana]XP_059435330.1 uncharacterized protein LOC132168224 [Corylus avellana]
MKKEQQREGLATARRAGLHSSRLTTESGGVRSLRMEEKESSRAFSHWWWALASGAQLGWGVLSYRRGCAGASRLMPLKAFAVASLFVGAGASASVSVLHASGIYKVEDLLEVGANIRRGLRVRPRTGEE